MATRAPDKPEFSVTPMTANSVILTYLDRDKFDLNPSYQRDSGIWTPDKRQLLIDSIINRYDIPKFYFHEDSSRKQPASKLAVIDGKQRLDAIWSFIENRFALSADFVYMRDNSTSLAGLTYGELSRDFPRVRAEFDNFQLSIMVVTTNEQDLIEDMFTRLNEAVPLSAAEKRNALGGPVPSMIRSLAKNELFTKRLPFSNRRYRHFDLACKLLLLADHNGFVDTKKNRLDQFVLGYKDPDKASIVKDLEKRAHDVVKAMANEFIDQDQLLKNVGLVTSYFVIYLRAMTAGKSNIIKRSKLEKFADIRHRNSMLAATDISQADYDLLRFDEFAANSVNDRSSILYKAKTICERMFPSLQELFPETV